MYRSAAARLLGAIAVVLGLSHAVATSAHGAPGDIHHLGTLGGSPSHGHAINDAGEVTGWSTISGATADHAFRYTGTPGAGGVMQDLGTLGAGSSYGFGINSVGQVVGRSAVSGNQAFHAFRYTGTPGAGGTMHDLGTLGGINSIARGINSAGQVTGKSQTLGNSSPEAGHAFLYTGTPGAGGAMVDLGTLGGAISEGRSVNDAGQVTGSSYMPGGSAEHAFLYTGTPGAGGVMLDLGTLGGTNSHGHAINNAGQVAGRSNTTGASISTMHAFRYTGVPGAGGAMVDLGTLGGTFSEAQDINDAGFVVGIAERAPGDGGFATLWQTDAANTAVDLDRWLDVTNPALGALWRLDIAFGINNRGLVTGVGFYEDGPGGLTDGPVAYILDASSLVPEPACPLLLVAVFALSPGRARSRRR